MWFVICDIKKREFGFAHVCIENLINNIAARLAFSTCRIQSVKLIRRYLKAEDQFTVVAAAPVTLTLIALVTFVTVTVYAGILPDFVSFTLVITAVVPVLLYVISYSANQVSVLMAPPPSPALPLVISNDTLVAVFVSAPIGATSNVAMVVAVSLSVWT